MRVRLKQKRLVDLIAQSGLSQNHWAIKIGVSRGHWSAIVNGKHPFPSPRTREMILEAFDIAFDELFEVESGPAEGADATFQAAIADRYLIDKEIGRGGMGTVYLARDVKHDRPVAIKVISAEAVCGIGVEQFVKEIRYTARLQHHHILPVHDSGVTCDLPFYVMPYMTDGSLRALLQKRGRVDMDECVRLAGGIAAALRYANDRSVLHCDVKPENVLLSESHPYVADFGISRVIHAEAFEWGRREGLDSSAGTPAYVSPEQASGEQHLDGRSDTYSLGCVVFEMLAGFPPFQGTTTMEIVAKRFVDVPNLHRIVPQVTRAAGEVVARAMSVDPADRPESAEVFVEELSRAAVPRKASVFETLSMAGTRMHSNTRRIVNARFPKFTKTIEEVSGDLRFALRTLRRSPIFALIAVLTLALGIGANAAVYTVVNGVLLKPLPFEDADQLAMVWTLRTAVAEPDTFTVSPADFVDWRAQASSFSDMAAFNINQPTVSGDRGAERIHAGLVTFNFFELLGARPMLGSGFTSDDERADGEPAVVLSHGFWQRWFGADPAVLDSTLIVSGRSYRIAGVMPPGYNHPDPNREFSDAQIWRAFTFDAETATRSSTYLRVIGRLRDGVSINGARAEMTAIARQLELAYPETNAGEQTVVIPLRDQHYSSIRPTLLLILGAAGFVLLIVCANVANLVLARSQSRRREFAVRTSLGAGRGRLARQLVAENTIVALAGGAIGLLVVAAGADLLRAMQDSFLSGVADIGVDFRVAGVMVGISLLVGLLFGILPVVDLSNTDLRDVLNEDSTSGGSGRRTHRFRAALVVGQVCIAVALLTGAGLLTRSFVHLVTVPIGFQASSVLTFETSAPRAQYPEHDERVQFFQSVVESLTSIPGVEAVGLNSDLPFSVWNQSTTFNFEHNLLAPEDAPSIEYHTVGPGYFRAMGIELLAGRLFEKTDGVNAPNVVVVNQELAGRYWPRVSPVGQRLLLGAEPDAPRATVIGVVADVLDDGFASSPEPSVYAPFMQRSVSGMSVVLRTSVAPASVAAVARQRMREVDPQAPASSVRPLRDLVAETVSGERMAMRLAIGFSVLAVLIAAIGIYGLMAFIVGARRHEIGIRAAIGADANDILRLVLRQSMGLAALGIVAGTLAGAVVARALGSVLFGVEPFDPISFLGSPALIAVAALAASYVPARRAITVQPVEALRAQ